MLNQIICPNSTQGQRALGYSLNYWLHQMQDGSSDCGLFTIAFATALASGIQPVRCFFNQGAMRSHLTKCLHEQNMTEFPIKKTRHTELKVKNITSLHVHCMCRMPEIPGSTMIQCSTCKMWYHFVFQFPMKQH